MSDYVADLQFKYDINHALKHGKSFDEIFAQEGFTVRFIDFLKGRIGQIWLKSEQGWDYRIWQGG